MAKENRDPSCQKAAQKPEIRGAPQGIRPREFWQELLTQGTSLVATLVLSCEHGGNRIPPRYRSYFAGVGRARALASHRGFDIGALALAKRLARLLEVPLVHSTTSRLLVDLNRSLHHPRLLSAFVTLPDEAARARLLDTHYHPYRRQFQARVRAAIARNPPVIHIAVHSFVARLNRETRRAEVGLLYDPARSREQRLCRDWQRHLSHQEPTLRVRLNYPYRGKADGLTSALRRQFPAGHYLGIELEVNQRLLLPRARPAAVAKLANALAQSLRQASGDYVASQR